MLLEAAMTAGAVPAAPSKSLSSALAVAVFSNVPGASVMSPSISSIPKRSICSELMVEIERGVSSTLLSKPNTEPTSWVGRLLRLPSTIISSIGSNYGTNYQKMKYPQVVGL